MFINFYYVILIKYKNSYSHPWWIGTDRSEEYKLNKDIYLWISFVRKYDDESSETPKGVL